MEVAITNPDIKLHIISYLPDDSNMQFVEFSCIYLMYSLKILNIEINLPDVQFVDFKCRNLSLYSLQISNVEIYLIYSL